MDIVSLILVIVGAVNWGLVGFAKFDLVAWIFGGQTASFSRVGRPGRTVVHHAAFPPPRDRAHLRIPPDKRAHKNALVCFHADKGILFGSKPQQHLKV